MCISPQNPFKRPGIPRCLHPSSLQSCGGNWGSCTRGLGVCLGDRRNGLGQLPPKRGRLGDFVRRSCVADVSLCSYTSFGSPSTPSIPLSAKDAYSRLLGNSRTIYRVGVVGVKALSLSQYHRLRWKLWHISFLRVITRRRLAYDLKVLFQRH